MYLYDKLSSPEQKKAQIRAQERYEMDKWSEIATARDLGKEEGIAEGLEKGKLEKEKQIVLNMKNQGLENEFIAKCLNIGIMELQQLLNN